MRSLTESFRECWVDKQTDDSPGHGSAVPNGERWTHSVSACVRVCFEEGRGRLAHWYAEPQVCVDAAINVA